MRFTIRDLLWLMVVVGVILGAYFIRPRQTLWEYKTLYSPSDAEMSAEGDKGWELVNAHSHPNGVELRTFKRRK